jgi:hypothetical protein
MTFRLKKKSPVFWKLILLGIAIPLFLLPFIHYHPETAHSHHEGADSHQHEGRYHSATLEAYAHLVNGHFSDRELDDHFHHAHSSEDEDSNDSEYFLLAKNSKSFKQVLVFKQDSSFFGISNPGISVPVDSETLHFKSRYSRSNYSTRSPPVLFL